MKILFRISNWIFTFFFLLLFLLSILSENYLPMIIILAGALLLLYPARKWTGKITNLSLPLWLRVISATIIFLLFLLTTFMGMGNKYSIYKNPEIKAGPMAIYDTRMEEWPVPYESRYLDTEFGKVHVIISGPEDAPPIFLLHASAMASWSWLYNIEGLNRHYRTYAVDTIGDAGRSELADINYYPSDGAALVELYQEIMDQLGVEKVSFIGASQGGFISTRMALQVPQRVNKLILCGPMGYGGTNISVLRIVLTTMFPLKPLQVSASRWAFGDNPAVQAAVGEWFELIIKGVVSRQASPMPFTPEQLNSLKMPVMVMLGTRDGLVGNPDYTKKMAQNIPDARIELLDTGHLISAERPDEFNRLISDFIGM